MRKISTQDFSPASLRSVITARKTSVYTTGVVLAALTSVVGAPEAVSAPRPTVTLVMETESDIPYRITYFIDNTAQPVKLQNVVGSWSITVPITNPKTAVVTSAMEPYDGYRDPFELNYHCTITSNTGVVIADEYNHRPGTVVCAGADSYYAKIPHKI